MNNMESNIKIKKLIKNIHEWIDEVDDYNLHNKSLPDWMSSSLDDLIEILDKYEEE